MLTVSALQAQMLTCIYWHRLVSTDQLRRMLRPHTHPSYVQRRLREVRAAGLAVSVRRPDKQLLWFTTTAGAALVEASGEVDARPYRMTATTALGALRRHTHDVVDTGLAFVESARRLGHECTPLSWTPEVAHRIADRRPRSHGDDVLIVDAVLRYVSEHAGQRNQYTLFIELDRASMPVARLARKLQQYLRYHDHVPRGGSRPAWQHRYPRWPRTVIVLAGAPDHVLDRRLADLRGHASALPSLHQVRDRFPVWATTLQRLRSHGPTAEIFVPVLAGDPTPTALILSGEATAT